MKNTQFEIGIYHPQKMNRHAYSLVLDQSLSALVTPVDNLFDLFSSRFSIVIIIEPEMIESEKKATLIQSLINSATKPIIIIPFYERMRSKIKENVTVLKCNPESQELVQAIQRIEEKLNNYSKQHK